MFLKRLISSLTIILLTFSLAAAQLPATQETARKDQPEEALKATASRAVTLLDEILKEAGQLRLAENRIHVQTIAADLLWRYDEARARSLFREATNELTLMLSSAPVNPDPDDEHQSYRTQRMQTQLRTKLLQALGRHDARLARDFLRSMRRLSQPATENARYAMPDDSQMELSLASQIATSDPKQAVEVAEESLAKGLSYQLPQVVAQLQQKDREAATKLASGIVAKLRSKNLSNDYEAASIAANLMRILVEPGAGASQTDGKSATPLVDEQVLRDLAEIIAGIALDDKSRLSDTLSLSTLMPALEKYAPSRAAQLRSRAAQSKRPNAEMDSDDYKALAEKGSVETLLEAAQKAPEHLRPQIYQQAAMKALSQDDPARAQQILTQNIKEVYVRKHMLAELEREILKRTAEKGKLDAARQLIAQASTNEERVRILTQVAEGIGAKGDKKVALQLLEEARGLTSGRARNIKQLTAQLQTAHAYAALDPARSLMILESLMDQLNELLNAGLLLGGFFGGEEVIKDDELLIQPISELMDRSSQQYVPDLGALALADFDRTRAVADSFQRDEVRLIARLLIAESVLGERPSTGSPPGVSATLAPNAPPTVAPTEP